MTKLGKILTVTFLRFMQLLMNKEAATNKFKVIYL